MPGVLRAPLLALIACYRRCISPWTPACCRFHPTCSAYAAEALRRHGAGKGSLLIAWRLLRCQPLARWGYDPVPEAGRWRHPERRLCGGRRRPELDRRHGERDPKGAVRDVGSDREPSCDDRAGPRAG